MTFQIGKARGTNPAVETKKPEEAPPSNVSPGILSPSPNTRWIPDAAPTSTWQKGVVSAEAKQQRAEAELNGTAITIGASEARIEAGNAIKQMQTVASSAGTIVQETTTTNAESEFGGDVVGSAQKGNEEALKAETNHDDHVAKLRGEALQEITDTRQHGDLPVGVAVA